MKHYGRKFGLAAFAGAVLVGSLIMFCFFIREPQAGLLLTVIGAPCLAIIGGFIGVEGFRDIKDTAHAKVHYKDPLNGGD